ncbi:MAG: hypothetical protein WDZ35_15355 [Crocinitomicaceae bacterium]
MKKIITLLTAFITLTVGIAQTTVYETGSVVADPWTGWSTPVTSNCTASVNGADVYQFTGTSGQSYTAETYRQFTINSNDLDLYFAVTAANATVSIEYSTDNVSYTQIGTQNWGASFSQSTLIVPTYDPVVSTFYLKLKISGTFGSPAQAQFNTFRIDAVLNTGNSNSIFPTNDQNIEVGVDGTTMMVTENPSAADSREWKYSNVSGSGYVSFSPTETGTNYTPNFASAGTYYVICESNFGGSIESSNEVKITVTEPASFETFEWGKTIQWVNQQLSISFSNTGYSIEIYDISGRQIAAEWNMKSYDFSLQHEGIYFVSMVNAEGERKTIKISNTK